ncbi:hypothetical protein [Nocardiopsis sp. CNR-923]|uniref:hypothetical protein n=1 Tax=Nocardiopsis sp. CNR-923 TaxID=1904965 RepID=UPI0013011382|nr:hypothetical protein [Nocardiopsis sp. CNR-923]
MAAIERLADILRALPLPIELPQVTDPETYTTMVDTLKRTLILMGQDPIRSAITDKARAHLMQSVSELVLIEEQLMFLQSDQENDANKVEEWRVIATQVLTRNATASLILAEHQLRQ